ncbi:TonB-dependent receptor plug domain-containing protein [Epilithonimonas mollis]|uniref:Iron complex outermembrane recepter protein n=1 Tax=Epilithonimonas mollis TaxID=216903 RepID=A0A1M6RTZ2_9FLAO|nr:TonB-dependent receptor [Epilithonimonas mollis]SHK35894.1 iron complex outermembrane recepter protein [Epilithonimonas mollis]
MKKLFFALFFILNAGQFSAQEILIDTLFIDNQFNKTSKTSKIISVNSEEILENATSLSDLLRFQSNIYIKENGRGATSSPSFRGTTAFQTAFVWNGININSIFLGQGDINNMNPLSYESIGIKFGGGSVIYGSGAIGGSIHLNNSLDFKRGFNGTFFTEYASFNTINSLVKANYSNEKFSFNLNINHSQSDNDYEVPEKKFINRNGAYQNTSFNLGLAYKTNPNNEFYWQSQHYDSDQHFPVFSENQTRTKYLVQTFRTLAGWKVRSESLKNNFKLAYLEDYFQYFGDVEDSKTNGGTGKQYIVKNDLDFVISRSTSINLISEYQYNEAKGFESGIQSPKRNLGSFSLLYRKLQTRKFYWELGAKQEIVEDYKSPFLFSASAKYVATNWYQTTMNISKNFRAPTFNDLYWKEGGNADLKPETSLQAEMSHRFRYKNFGLGITPYYMHIIDNITWIPVNGAIWSPININKVDAYGLETDLSFEKQFGKHFASSKLSYSYTRSVNLETQRQMRYVPTHRINFNADYQYSFFGIFVQAFYNGKTYIDSIEKDFLNDYLILNSGINFKIFKNNRIGFRVNNITSQAYQAMNYYYMPKRNYAVNLKLNF